MIVRKVFSEAKTLLLSKHLESELFMKVLTELNKSLQSKKENWRQGLEYNSVAGNQMIVGEVSGKFKGKTIRQYYLAVVKTFLSLTKPRLMDCKKTLTTKPVQPEKNFVSQVFSTSDNECIGSCFVKQDPCL